MAPSRLCLVPLLMVLCAGCFLRKEDEETTGATTSVGAGGSGASSSVGGSGGSGGAPIESDWETPDSGTTAALDAVWAAGDIVIAVGEAGTIVRSSDAGVSWATVDAGTTSDLFGVWHDRTNVYVVGALGAMLYSDDGGQSYVTRDVGVAADLTAVWGLGNGEVLVSGLGTSLHHSIDHGESWTERSTSSFAGIWGLDAMSLYAISDKFVRQSDDAGVTWTTMTGSYATTDHRDVWAFSDNYILAVTNYGTLFSYDGNWSYSIPLNDQNLNGIWGSGTSNVFVVGDGGGMMRSSSQEQCTFIDTQLDLGDVHGDNGRVYVVGDGGTIFTCAYVD